MSQEQEEHDDKLENELTGLIPEIKEKMRLLEKKQSSRDQLEIQKAEVTGTFAQPLVVLTCALISQSAVTASVFVLYSWRTRCAGQWKTTKLIGVV